MSCNRDEYCKTIANDYIAKDISIKKDFSNIRKVIDDITTDLGLIVVPDDYLGTKVVEKLDKLKIQFNDNISDIENVSEEISRFARQKHEEHEWHYEEWLEEQENSSTNDAII